MSPVSYKRSDFTYRLITEKIQIFFPFALIFNFTKKKQHPGGEEVLIDAAGRDGMISKCLAEDFSLKLHHILLRKSINVIIIIIISATKDFNDVGHSEAAM